MVRTGKTAMNEQMIRTTTDRVIAPTSRVRRTGSACRDQQQVNETTIETRFSPDGRPLCNRYTRTGEPCPNRVTTGRKHCFAHDPAAKERNKQASLASVKARQQRVADRLQASEQAKLTLTERIHRQAAERAEELACALVQAAITDPHGRAMAHVLDRVEGKVTDRLETSALEPGQMSAAELERWLRLPSQEPDDKEE